jgi:CBS domain-containing protein
MIVRDVMTHGAERIPPTANLQEAADRMKSLEVGILPVCEKDRVVGMVTDRDITIRATACHCNATETRVREIMTPRVIYVYDDQDVCEAASHCATIRFAGWPF